MNESFDNLVDYIDDYDEENEILNEIVTEIYEKYDLIESKTLYNSKVENIIYLFDDLVDAFKTAKKYLYFTPISYYPLMNLKQGDFLEDEGECNSDPEPESDSSETSDEGSNSKDEELKKD